MLAISFRRCNNAGRGLWADKEIIPENKRLNFAIDFIIPDNFDHTVDSQINNYMVNHPHKDNEIDAAEFRLDGEDCKIPLNLNLEPYSSVYRDHIENTPKSNYRIEETEAYL